MTIFRSKSIRSRLFKILLLSFGGVVAAIVTVWNVTVEPSLRMGVAKEQQQLAQRVADQIDEFLEHRIAELQIAVEVSRFWEDEGNRQKEALYRLLKVDPLVHEISVVNREGQEILRLSRTQVYSEADLISVAREEKFHQTSQGKIYVGKVYHPRTNEPFITLAVPIKFTAREIRGAVIAEVSLKTLWDSISHIKVGKTGHAFVVEQDGQLIAHPDYSKVLLGTHMAHLHQVRKFLSHSHGNPDLGEVVIGQEGQEVISTFALAKRRPWGVFVEEPALTSLAEVRAVEKFTALVGVFLLAGVFGLSYWFSERIAQPVRRLEEGTKRIAQGNLDHKLEIHTGDEIETLAHNFNQMAQALKTSYAGLEAKITERTKELSTLYAVLTPLAQTRSLNEMLDKVIERLMGVTGSDAALIRILDKNLGSFIHACQRGFPDRYLKAAEVKPTGTAVGSVFGNNEPIISPDIVMDPRFKEKLQLHVGLYSCALLPLRVAGEIRGVIHLASRGRGHFSEEKKGYLMAVAHQMGIAIENRELFEAIKASKEDLERANKVKDEFLSVMSHELRTPLHIVVGYTEMMKDQMLGEINKEQKAALEKVINRSQVLLNMIAGILEATSIEAGAVQVECANVDLCTFLGEFRSSCDIPLDDGLSLLWDYPSDLPSINTDGEKLKHILQNLIHNAIKFTPKGQVTVSVRYFPSTKIVEFNVTDTGVGIAEELQPFIFEMFRQGDSSETRLHGGVGLGLYIVKKWTELLGGTVGVKSKPGAGSSFTVTIPSENYQTPVSQRATG